jgi:hypothetical protein
MIYWNDFIDILNARYVAIITNVLAISEYIKPLPVTWLLNENVRIQLIATIAKSASNTIHLGAGVDAKIFINDIFDNLINNRRLIILYFYDISSQR